jgi:hypothetical protein
VEVDPQAEPEPPKAAEEDEEDEGWVSTSVERVSPVGMPETMLGSGKERGASKEGAEGAEGVQPAALAATLVVNAFIAWAVVTGRPAEGEAEAEAMAEAKAESRAEEARVEGRQGPSGDPVRSKAEP